MPINEQTLLIEAALDAKRRGWEPLYVPQGAKNPGRARWQEERLSEEQIPGTFARSGKLRLLTGEPSGGLTDVDLDAIEALACSDNYLPPTRMAHGRPSKPNSHRWYMVTPSPRLKQWRDTDGSMLVELRGTGGHTLIPPSVHLNGETLSWTHQGDPAQVDLVTLQTACARIAATSILARHWPAKGSRHHAALAVGGFLLRGGLEVEPAARLVESAAKAAGDEEWQSRGQDVRDTARNLQMERSVTGLPTVTALLRDGERVAPKLRDWLSLKTPAGGPEDWSPLLPFVEIAGPPFPSNLFPQPIQEFVVAQATALQTPVDLIGCLVLGAGAVACAGRCVIHLNKEWAEPLNLFMVVALPSGERKSPAFRAIAAPLEERERELAMNAQPEIALAGTQIDILNGQLQGTKSRAAKVKDHKERDHLTEEAAELARELAGISVPTSPRLIADDATSEAVATLLADQGGRIAVMSTEGGLFETLAGRYSQGVVNLDVYLKGYSGDPLRIDRKSRPAEYVAKPALTLCLTLQPDVIRELATKPGFRGRGLLARFLYSIPKSMVGYRSNTAPPVPDTLRQKYHTLMKDLFKAPHPPEGQEQAICLSPEAYEVFQSYRDRVEYQLRPGTELYEIQDWGNKLCGAVARLAGILHMIQHAGNSRPWEIPVSGTVMESAIGLGDYFTAHANVAFAMMGADPRVEKARRLWSIVQHLGVAYVSQRDLWQHVRRSFTPHDLTDTLQLLIDMGYLRPMTAAEASGPGRPRSPMFEINPLACTQNTQNPPKPVSEGNFEDFVDSVYSLPVLEAHMNNDVGEV